jgi:hypothetical protein
MTYCPRCGTKFNTTGQCDCNRKTGSIDATAVITPSPITYKTTEIVLLERIIELLQRIDRNLDTLRLSR